MMGECPLCGRQLDGLQVGRCPHCGVELTEAELPPDSGESPAADPAELLGDLTEEIGLKLGRGDTGSPRHDVAAQPPARPPGTSRPAVETELPVQAQTDAETEKELDIESALGSAEPATYPVAGRRRSAGGIAGSEIELELDYEPGKDAGTPGPGPVVESSSFAIAEPQPEAQPSASVDPGPSRGVAPQQEPAAALSPLPSPGTRSEPGRAEPLPAQGVGPSAESAVAFTADPPRSVTPGSPATRERDSAFKVGSLPPGAELQTGRARSTGRMVFAAVILLAVGAVAGYFYGRTTAAPSRPVATFPVAPKASPQAGPERPKGPASMPEDRSSTVVRQSSPPAILPIVPQAPPGETRPEPAGPDAAAFSRADAEPAAEGPPSGPEISSSPAVAAAEPAAGIEEPDTSLAAGPPAEGSSPEANPTPAEPEAIAAPAAAALPASSPVAENPTPKAPAATPENPPAASDGIADDREAARGEVSGVQTDGGQGPVIDANWFVYQNTGEAYWTVQLATFTQREKALQSLRQFEKSGYAVYVIEKSNRNGRPYFHLRYGRYGSRAEGMEAAEPFHSRELVPYIIVRSFARMAAP